MTDLALANAVVALAALIQAACGIGFAMITVPLLALIDLNYVPGPSLFAMLGLSVIMAVRGRQDVDYRGLPALLPSLVAGTIVGALTLVSLPDTAMGPLFGSMVLVALAVGQIGIVPKRSYATFAVSGGLAGLMGTMSGIHGPALVVLYQDATPRITRATIALIFVVASCLSLLSLNVNQLFDHADMVTGLTLWPGVLCGYLLAIGIGHHIPDAVARYVMLGLAAISAMLLIAQSVAWDDVGLFG